MRLLFFFLAVVTFSFGQTYSGFVLGAGYDPVPPIPVAPFQIATFFVGGLPQTVDGLAKLQARVVTASGPNAAQVIAAKPIDGSTLEITVQLPQDLLDLPRLAKPSIQFGEIDDPAGSDLCSQNTCSQPISLRPIPANAHIIGTCDSFYTGTEAGTPCRPVITHQSGQLVTNNLPAKIGEVLTIWALGLGVPTAGLDPAASGPIALSDVVLQTGFISPSAQSFGPTRYLFAGLPSRTQGLYQVNFAVPAPPIDLAACESSGGNMTIFLSRSFGVQWFNVSGFIYNPVTSVRTGDIVTISGLPLPSHSICVATP